LEHPQLEDNWSQPNRLRSVLLGQRNLALQSLEIMIPGYDSPEKAERAFRQEMATLVDPMGNETHLLRARELECTAIDVDLEPC
jgi:hypothetical protein